MKLMCVKFTEGVPHYVILAQVPVTDMRSFICLKSKWMYFFGLKLLQAIKSKIHHRVGDYSGVFVQ